MSVEALERIIEQLPRLTEMERKRLQYEIEGVRPSSMGATDHERIRCAMVAAGLLNGDVQKPAMTPADIARFKAFEPFRLEGRPISEDLIEDRR